MIAFIDDHREAYGVEPICKVLPIAPSTYHTHAARRTDPEGLPARATSDAALMVAIRRVFEANFRVYGVRKVWRQLSREGVAVARCTVARLMRVMGLQGVVRGRKLRTTVPDPAATCSLDRVNRQFKAPHPNALWVSDFTYVATWSGFVYVAFVIDAFARRIVGWRASRTAHAGFVLDALEQALHERRPLQGAATTTPWPRRSTVCSRPRSSIAVGRGAASRRSSSPRSNGSTGSTTVACSNRSETYLPPRPKRATLRRSRSRPWPRDSHQMASGKPGAVQTVR